MKHKIVIFLFGGLVGGVVTYLFCDKKQEIEFVEDDFEPEISVDDDNIAKIDMVEYVKQARTYTNAVFEDKSSGAQTNYGKSYRNQEDPADFESPEDDVPEVFYDPAGKIPYLITVDEYNDEKQHHDKLLYSYYMTDKALVDDNERLVEDYNVVGYDNLGLLKDNYQEIFVRNDELEMDFEIQALVASFVDSI